MKSNGFRRMPKRAVRRRINTPYDPFDFTSVITQVPSLSSCFHPTSQGPNTIEGAIQRNDIEKLKKLLNEGADPNVFYDNKMTPLVWCIEADKFVAAKILIDAGANTCGPYSTLSPLYTAICKGNVPMIKLLVENGAEFFLHEGLITAIEKQNIEIVRELIKLGANVNNPNSRSELPVICAVGLKNWDILKLLIEHGGDLNVTYPNGDTVLMTVVRTMYIPMIKYLLEQKVNLNTKNCNNETALSISLENDDFRTFKLLMEAGADAKLASEVIEDKSKTNSSLATYMSKMVNIKTDDVMRGFSGHEQAPNY